MALRLAGLVLVAALLVIFAVLDTASSATCGAPDADREAGQLGRAEDGYDALLKEDPGADCAVRGLRATQCGMARRYFNAELFEEAEKRFREVVKAHPRADCANTGLADVGSELCRRAKELLDKKLLTEAEKAYTALLAFEPRPSCIPCDLKKLKDAKKDEEKKEEPPKPPAPPPPACCCCGPTCQVDP
jgi:tetratricopeptide (TPR) repeat protein